MVRQWWRSRLGGSLLRELVLVVALLLAYKYGRFLTRGHVATAIRNAHDVIGLERSLGVFTEARLQELVTGSTAVMRFLNAYYLVAHVAVTAAALVWLYWRHPDGYRRFRNVTVVITLLGMFVHLVLPLAPPRMFPRLGFVDTAKVVGPASYGAGSPYKGFANQFAAMPSLHFGWALVIAWAVIVAAGIHSRWRYLVVLHPALTLTAIVLTANHYWLDAVVAMLLFGFALAVDHFTERRRAERALRAAAVDAPAPAARSARSSTDSPSTYRPATPRVPASPSATSCRASRSRD
jgi:hypothetical protein